MTRSIAIAGKGGVGKSTIAALIVSHLCRNGQGPVLAIDADPDANLGTLLGIKVEQSIGDLREDLRKKLGDLPAGMSKASYFEAGLHQIIEEASGFDLITMGKGEGSGCYCSLNNLIRKFSEDLMPSYAWAVFDNEAGLEHISRRTTSNIDALIVVVNDNPLSLDTARTIGKIAKDMDTKIGKQYLVANMIREGREAGIIEQTSELPMEFICSIPVDPKLEEVVSRGQAVSELPESVIKDRISLIIKTIGEQHATT